MIHNIWNKLFGKFSIPQYLVGIGATLVMLQVGILYGWTSPYLVYFSDPASKIPITKDQASWIASLNNLGCLAGAIIGFAFVHLLGSRIGTLVSFFPTVISWTVIYFAQTPNWLYVGRIAGGISIGISFAVFPLFVGEVTSPVTRGAMVSIAFTGSPIGGILASFLGSRLSHQTSSVCFLIPCALGICVFLLLRDSPHFLVRNHRIQDAEDCLKWYRGDVNVDREFRDIVKYVEYSSCFTFNDQLNEIRFGYIRKALLVVVVLYMFMQVTGINTLGAYAETILREAKFVLIEPSVLVTLLYLVATVFSLVGGMTVDRFGRKVLMIVSSIGVSASMTALGSYILMIESGYDTDEFQLLLPMLFCLFQGSLMIGIHMVPSVILSELFPVHVKGLAGCLASIASGLCAFLSAKAYQIIVDSIGKYSVFYLHAILAALVIPFVIFVMPETKGKSLNKIQEELMEQKR